MSSIYTFSVCNGNVIVNMETSDYCLLCFMPNYCMWKMLVVYLVLFLLDFCKGREDKHQNNSKHEEAEKKRIVILSESLRECMRITNNNSSVIIIALFCWYWEWNRSLCLCHCFFLFFFITWRLCNKISLSYVIQSSRY